MNKALKNLLTHTGTTNITVTNSETDEVCNLYTNVTFERYAFKLQIFDNETGEFYGALKIDENILHQLIKDDENNLLPKHRELIEKQLNRHSIHSGHPVKGRLK